MPVRFDHDSTVDSVKVSVVIPVYGDLDGALDCVRAIRHDELDPPIEIIVVDNGSVPALDADDLPAHVRVLREPEPGSYAARNTGVAAAAGEIVAFTDSDCIPDSGWIAAALRRFREADHPDLVAGRVRVQRTGVPATSAELYERLFAFRNDLLVRKQKAVTANLFVRREVLERLGGFDTAAYSGGDFEFCERACSSGFELAYAEAAVVEHPPRRSLGELRRKIARTVGGVHASASSGSVRHQHRFSLVFMLRDTLYSIFEARRLFSDERSREMSAGERLRVLLVILHNATYKNLVKIRYRASEPRSYARR